MTDRELIEKAAKAAGLEQGKWDEETGCWKYQFRSPLTNMHLWNPLTDDGDALRLAVHLQIDIGYGLNDRGETIVVIVDSTLEEWVTPEQDAFAATRRVIVRTAASEAP
jgi:hypothetical protein